MLVDVKTQGIKEKFQFFLFIKENKGPVKTEANTHFLSALLNTY